MTLRSPLSPPLKGTFPRRGRARPPGFALAYPPNAVALPESLPSLTILPSNMITTSRRLQTPLEPHQPSTHKSKSKGKLPDRPPLHIPGKSKGKGKFTEKGAEKGSEKGSEQGSEKGSEQGSEKGSVKGSGKGSGKGKGSVPSCCWCFTLRCLFSLALRYWLTLLLHTPSFHIQTFYFTAH